MTTGAFLHSRDAQWLAQARRGEDEADLYLDEAGRWIPDRRHARRFVSQKAAEREGRLRKLQGFRRIEGIRTSERGRNDDGRVLR